MHHSTGKCLVHLVQPVNGRPLALVSRTTGAAWGVAQRALCGVPDTVLPVLWCLDLYVLCWIFVCVKRGVRQGDALKLAKMFP